MNVSRVLKNFGSSPCNVAFIGEEEEREGRHRKSQFDIGISAIRVQEGEFWGRLIKNKRTVGVYTEYPPKSLVLGGPEFFHASWNWSFNLDMKHPLILKTKKTIKKPIASTPSG